MKPLLLTILIPLLVSTYPPPERVESQSEFQAGKLSVTPEIQTPETKVTLLKEIVTPTPTPTSTPKIVRQTSYIPKVDTNIISGNEAALIAQKRALNEYGWSGAEWDALYWIVQHESGWRSTAVNKSSGACGLFQAYPCSKLGSNWQDLNHQITWGLNYIKKRYGSPTAAKAFWLQKGWY